MFSNKTIAIRSLGAALLATSALIPGLASAEITVTHAQGEVTLKEAPKKVAVFDLASLDIINALGVDVVAGIPKAEDGTANVPEYLSAYGDAKYEGVGTLFEPDLEKLREIAPDLIIIAGRSASKYDEVKDIAPTIDMTQADKGLVEAATDATRTLGEIFAVSEKAGELIDSMQAAVTTMHEAAPADETALVIFSIGDNMMPHAPGARFGTLYDYTGLKASVPAAEPAARTPRPEPGSPEAEAARKLAEEQRDAALATNPDWIITLDRGAITSEEPSNIAERITANEKIAATSAYKKGQVIHLDPRSWYLVGNGVQNLTDTARSITEAFEGQ